MDTTPREQGQPTPPAAATAVAAPARVLVAYATRHGSTAEVADWIAEEVRAAGADVDVAPAAAVPKIQRYAAIVLGGPMIRGWHRDACRFLKRHAGELADKPTALFITAASLTETGEEQAGGVPLTKDPWLVKEPRNPSKLTYKENYARPAHYLEDVFRAAPALQPQSIAFFAGSLDLSTMNLFEKLFVMLVVRATPGDARNQKAVRAWAQEITPRLLG
jgi:menaquinone-dependent protoporphyrinogen oxidase